MRAGAPRHHRGLRQRRDQVHGVSARQPPGLLPLQQASRGWVLGWFVCGPSSSLVPGTTRGAASWLGLAWRRKKVWAGYDSSAGEVATRRALHHANISERNAAAAAAATLLLLTH